MIKVIKKKLSDLGYKDVEINIPGDIDNGDFTSNVALQKSKELGKNPRELSREIVDQLGNIEGVKKIEIAGPGFINFYLETSVLIDFVSQIEHSPREALGNNAFAGEKVMLEYTTQNVLKQFHLGHLMSNTIGLSIANLLEISGAVVARDSYQGDVGMHIAKAVWGMGQLHDPAVHGDKFEELNRFPDPSEFLGLAYATGANAYDENSEQAEEIKEINRIIYHQEPGEIFDRYLLARKLSLESYKTVYERLGVELDFNIFESETAEPGIEESMKALTKGILVKSDGAVMYQPAQGEKLIPVVFINGEGFPTYAAKDLGLVKVKQELWSPDRTVVFTASEQNGHFAVVKKVLNELYPELRPDFLTHIGHGYLTLTSGKMSSRGGNVLTADQALEQIKGAVLVKMAERNIIDLEKDRIAEQVAISALRFTILRGGINRDVVFDFDQALSFEGDSGPYLQYSTVRLRSILHKAHADGFKESLGESSSDDIKLLRQLYRLPGVIERSAVELAPQLLVSELLSLAKEANGYYTQNRIINEDDAELTNHRLLIISAVANALEVGLSLLGIQVPIEM